jgi:DNA polymerase II large subunit
MCEDYPCCGHSLGDCPTHDSKGREVYRCVECGKKLSRKATSSICAKCQKAIARNIANGYDDYFDER